VSLPLDFSIDEVAFQLARHLRCTVGAHADESYTPAWQSLQCGNSDLRRKALGDDLALLEGDKEDATHRFSSRFAAAMASLALV
jgi:hypothetical protein